MSQETTDQKKITLKITTVVAIVLFLVSLIFAVALWKGNIEGRVGFLENSIIKQEERLKSLEADNVEIKVKLASIDTRLSNIEMTLIEIKNKL